MQDGSYEVDETKKIIIYLKEAEIFIDVGANISYYPCIARSIYQTFRALSISSIRV